MPTSRKLRAAKNRIPSHITEEFLGGLRADDFLGDELTEEERKLVREFEKCKCNFEKWLKFRERKIERAKA